MMSIAEVPKECFLEQVRSSKGVWLISRRLEAAFCEFKVIELRRIATEHTVLLRLRKRGDVVDHNVHR